MMWTMNDDIDCRQVHTVIGDISTRAQAEHVVVHALGSMYKIVSNLSTSLFRASIFNDHCHHDASSHVI